MSDTPEDKLREISDKMNSPSHLPNTREYLEAHQEELNRLKAESKTMLTPEQRAQLDIIERVAGELEAAGIPFALFASDGRPSFWQFNKVLFGNEEPMDSIPQRRMNSLLSNMLGFVSHVARELTIICCKRADGEPIGAWIQGQWVPHKASTP